MDTTLRRVLTVQGARWQLTVRYMACLYIHAVFIMPREDSSWRGVHHAPRIFYYGFVPSASMFCYFCCTFPETSENISQ